jgi:hypothetical protein
MAILQVIVAFLASSCILPTLRAETVTAKANPIRRVVNMLEAMQKKVVAEGEKEEELFKKFMCYCKTNKGELEDTIAAAETKGPQVSAAIEEAEGQKAQLEADLVAHKADRESAKKSIADATAIREKEAAAYAKSNAEGLANTAAISKAVAALEKGAAGGFLQTNTAQLVQRLIESNEAIIDADRQTVLAFLSGGQASGYAPQSGQITGILKQIGDTMAADMAEETAAEEAAIKEHEGLMSAKTKEIAAHTAAIEDKTVRAGEVAVSIVNQKNDLADTQEALEKDKAFLAELEKGCSTKEAEWEERQKVRADELVALAETIKILNDDDALELFKKALPSPESSFVQLSGSMKHMRAHALAEVRTAQQVAGKRAPGLDLIALALRGKTAGFEKVTAMIDEMVEVLKKEQVDDDKKKDYCAVEFDTSDDKKKVLEKSISDLEGAASVATEGITTLTGEIKALVTGIEELDKSVSEATEQRQKEHADYTELIALDTQAKDLLGVAKNRLNKFYNPSQYIAPPKKELTQEEKIYQSVVPAEPEPPAFMQIDQTNGVAPPPPPETFGAYEKKGEETGGVLAMVDMLVKDLDKEMTEAETSEKDAQKDYETLMEDAKAKRAADSKSISGKESAKADLEEELQSHTEAKAAATKELMATAEYISGLHSECDWLVENHEARKTARAGEVESLKNAKAVLAGADYSLVQLHHTRYLRGPAASS